MRFLTQAWKFIACCAGVAAQSPSRQYAGSRISRMFLDAHAPDQPKYSRSEIKAMIRNAKTPDDFMRLADYFDYQALEYEQKSQDELKELQRLLALRYHARTYPTQVSNTRDLIARYKAKVQECSARADAYRASATASSAPEVSAPVFGTNISDIRLCTSKCAQSLSSLNGFCEAVTDVGFG